MADQTTTSSCASASSVTTVSPKCVATSSSPSTKLELSPQSTPNRFVKSLQWSADGTCLLATSADNSISTFVVPADLLDDTGGSKIVSPYYTFRSKEAVNATTGYPFFNIQEPATALVLSSVRDHPVRLTSALTGDLAASYPLVNPNTEAFICPHSLAFNSQGNRFIAGSDSLISIFDVSRPGDEPISSMPTGPKTRLGSDYNGTMNMRGIVSALTVDVSSGLLAAGTYSRSVGLYDSSGEGDCVGVFSIKGTAADEQIGGAGITQVLWSSCGRYLYVAERKSDGVMVYDIRKTGQLLSWLEGRKAHTNQRLGVDLVSTSSEGCQEMWAGGIDGSIRMWQNPQQSEGAVLATFEFQGHDDAVSSTVMHRGGGVLASSSGQRHIHNGDQVDTEQHEIFDNCINIWTL